MNSTLSSLNVDAMENGTQLIISVCSAKSGHMSFLLALNLVRPRSLVYIPVDGYDSGNSSTPFCILTDGSIAPK
jgi:hypothetical protein